MATQKFTNFNKFFFMDADMTAVTIQSNKIVSNQMNFLANLILNKPGQRKFIGLGFCREKVKDAAFSFQYSLSFT